MHARLALTTPALVALLGFGLGGCSDDEGDSNPDPSPGATEVTTAPVIDPCILTAKVDGVKYHARGIYGDYTLDEDTVTGPLSPCKGVEGVETTFHLVAGVRQEWALVADVDGRAVFFLTDTLPPIRSDTEFARILVGDEAD